MVIRRSSSDKLPKDAVSLTELEATTYVWDVVSNWDSLYDTWALRYAPAVLGGISALSGAIINNHYRKKLRLGNFGYFSSIIPVTLMPCLLTALFHRHLVTTELLLMKNEACPICYEVRSASIQAALGLSYPLVLAPTSALMFANRYTTTRMPSLSEGPRVMFDFVRKLTRPLTPTLASLAALHLIASSILTYFEMRNNFQIRTKIEVIENNLIKDGR